VRPCRQRSLQKELRTFLRRHADDLPPESIRSATVRSKLENWLVRCDDRGILAAARVDPNDWYLCTLKNAAVRPDARGRGVGRQLYMDLTQKALGLRTLEGHLRCHVLAADVTSDNVPSIRAIERAGFRPVNEFCWARGQKPATVMHYVRLAPKDRSCV